MSRISYDEQAEADSFRVTLGSVLLEKVVIIPWSRKASMNSVWGQRFLVAG